MLYTVALGKFCNTTATQRINAILQYCCYTQQKYCNTVAMVQFCNTADIHSSNGIIQSSTDMQLQIEWQQCNAVIQQQFYIALRCNSNTMQYYEILCNTMKYNATIQQQYHRYSNKCYAEPQQSTSETASLSTSTSIFQPKITHFD